MARGKKHQPQQVVNLLRQIEVAVANGKTTEQACRDAGIVEQTYYRWRKEYGGLQVDQAKRLKELEQENAKLTTGQRVEPGDTFSPSRRHIRSSHGREEWSIRS